MSDSAQPGEHGQGNKAERVKRQEDEKLAGRTLDAATDEAIAIALALAPEVADAPTAEASERVIDVALASVSEANYVRKRINAALTVDEWQVDISLWVWLADTHKRPPLSDRGRERGFELRLERAPERA